MIDYFNSAVLVAISAIVTFALRALPFALLGGKKQMPDGIKRISDMLPASIMAVLVVFCIKSDLYGILSITRESFILLLSSVIALIAVVLIHLWKRQTLLSIAVGTILYMILIRTLPIIIVI